MAMIFCRGCGKEIHDSAPTCPHCGAAQVSQMSKNQVSQGSKWMAITSLALGIFSLLAAFGLLDEGFDPEGAAGIVLFVIGSLVLGVISVVQKKWGKGLSIGGIVVSAISLLIVLGSFA